VVVGAAGTLVVRKPGLRAKFLAELRRKLPFEPIIALCDGSDLIRLEMDNPFGTEPPLADVVQFVSILSEAGRRRVSLPIALPEGGEWLVRIIGSKNRLVYGVYRRQMKTIGYLGQIDSSLGRQRQRAVGTQYSQCYGFWNPTSPVSRPPELRTKIVSICFVVVVFSVFAQGLTMASCAIIVPGTGAHQWSLRTSFSCGC